MGLPLSKPEGRQARVEVIPVVMVICNTNGDILSSIVVGMTD